MANSSSILDRVLSDLKKSDDVALLKTFEELCGIYNSSRFLMPEEHFPLIGRSLYRDVNAETVYLPHHVKADNTKPSVALRSEPSGNCLYSSASLALVGSNALIHTLRAMVSIELFIYANYYCYHPIFTSTLEKHGDKVSVSAKNVLAMSCCFESVDSRLSGLDLVKMEALCNCRDKIWGSFVYTCSLLSY
ncbi:uncharacterized protein LOC124457062 [Xenia sp. Carnegie-2017]|uniref:uncharacterized protein LOC124457062 n=1 Tax=Xenia sp. Carnegie-2017 TaxID=2897299 RepID=UPI001F0357CB|nr:uncharacterized protein LOC124457062 [Xenia sp. Carnegie-2017]